MTIDFEHLPHPRIAERRKAGPPKQGDDDRVGLTELADLIGSRPQAEAAS